MAQQTLNAKKNTEVKQFEWEMTGMRFCDFSSSPSSLRFFCWISQLSALRFDWEIFVIICVISLCVRLDAPQRVKIRCCCFLTTVPLEWNAEEFCHSPSMWWYDRCEFCMWLWPLDWLHFFDGAGRTGAPPRQSSSLNCTSHCDVWSVQEQSRSHRDSLSNSIWSVSGRFPRISLCPGRQTDQHQKQELPRTVVAVTSAGSASVAGVSRLTVGHWGSFWTINLRIVFCVEYFQIRL
jgi:hypothetical protein